MKPKGKHNKKGVAHLKMQHLKMTSVRLEEKLQQLKTFDESLLSLTDMKIFWKL